MASMRRSITLSDIAAQACVGVPTVDRVLNKRAPVAPMTAERVLAAADRLGYHHQGRIWRRLDEKAPVKTFAFVLQEETSGIHRGLAEALKKAALDLRDVRAVVEICFVASRSAAQMAEEIDRMREVADAVALLSMDHPAVTAAISRCAARGTPVFGLLSPLSAPDIAGYIGIDGRKAGRTAGWMMSRLVRPHAAVGVLAGSSRYLGHDLLESGFRSALREYAPKMTLRDPPAHADDAAGVYEAALKALQSYPDLCGVYHCGGGVSAVVQALKDSGRQNEVAYICHDAGQKGREALLEGVADLVIATPLAQIVEAVTWAMAAVTTNRKPIHLQPLPFEILTPENP